MFSIEKFEGLVAAPFTPMDKKGNITPDLVAGYYDLLERNGISGAFINGSTGEGASLTQREKQINAEAWAACFRKGGKVRIINLVGGTSLQECIENAVFSRESGISAIAVLPPYYFKPASDTLLAEFVAKVGESVPGMPVYFYHIPVLTGVSLSVSGFLKKISGMLPNFAGIKFTHEDLMDFFTCLSYRDGYYDILWGRDECLLSALVLGCRGAVGSTYNYAAPLYNELIDAFDRGDLSRARELQLKSIDIVTVLGRYGGMPAGKAFMKYIGFDCGEFRPPFRNMDSDIYSQFSDEVGELGIDRYLSVIS